MCHLGNFFFQFYWDKTDILYKFKMYSIMIQLTLWNDYHNKFIEHPSSHMDKKIKEIKKYPCDENSRFTLLTTFNMDGPRVCHTEWSKSEREKQISYINTYMWNLEKWHRWSYLQSRNRDTYTEIKHMDTKAGGVLGWVGRLGLTYIHFWYYV